MVEEISKGEEFQKRLLNLPPMPEIFYDRDLEKQFFRIYTKNMCNKHRSLLTLLWGFYYEASRKAVQNSDSSNPNAVPKETFVSNEVNQTVNNAQQMQRPSKIGLAFKYLIDEASNFIKFIFGFKKL